MEVLIQVGALFLLMAVGYFLGLRKLLEAHAIRGMSNLIVKATLPALMLMSLQKPFSKELLGDALKTLLVATLFYACILALSLFVARIIGKQKTDEGQAQKSGSVGAFAFALAFSNSAFVGFPVIASILGTEALFLASIHNILFNILAFSVGVLIISSKKNNSDSDNSTIKGESRLTARIPIKNIFNINVISAIIGFLFFIGSISIPTWLALPLNMLGSMTTPLAMIVTGAMLARTPIFTVLGNWKLYVITAIRLIIWPLLTAIVLRLFGISGNLFYITVIVAGMPAASNTSLLAEVYGGDSETASSVVFMTTLFSVLTIPILAIILTR